MEERLRKLIHSAAARLGEVVVERERALTPAIKDERGRIAIVPKEVSRVFFMTRALCPDVTPEDFADETVEHEHLHNEFIKHGVGERRKSAFEIAVEDCAFTIYLKDKYRAAACKERVLSEMPLALPIYEGILNARIRRTDKAGLDMAVAIIAAVMRDPTQLHRLGLGSCAELRRITEQMASELGKSPRDWEEIKRLWDLGKDVARSCLKNLLDKFSKAMLD